MFGQIKDAGWSVAGLEIPDNSGQNAGLWGWVCRDQQASSTRDDSSPGSYSSEQAVYSEDLLSLPNHQPRNWKDGFPRDSSRRNRRKVDGPGQHQGKYIYETFGAVPFQIWEYKQGEEEQETVCQNRPADSDLSQLKEKWAPVVNWGLLRLLPILDIDWDVRSGRDHLEKVSLNLSINGGALHPQLHQEKTKHKL